MRVLVFLVGLSVGCGPQRTSDQTQPRDSTESSPNPLLVALREDLARVRAAGPSEHLEAERREVQGLLGLLRTDIEGALGEPNRCRMQEMTECPAGPDGVIGECRTAMRAVPAPCQNETDTFYSFYHLPENWLGGGPELLLRYDADGRCTVAEWRLTE